MLPKRLGWELSSASLLAFLSDCCNVLHVAILVSVNTHSNSKCEYGSMRAAAHNLWTSAFTHEHTVIHGRQACAGGRTNVYGPNRKWENIIQSVNVLKHRGPSDSVQQGHLFFYILIFLPVVMECCLKHQAHWQIGEFDAQKIKLRTLWMWRSLARCANGYSLCIPYYRQHPVDRSTTCQHRTFRNTDASVTTQFAHINFISLEAFSSIYKTWLGEVKGAGEKGPGQALVRPPGLVMQSTPHPGKGSLRSSGPICSRRGKWHIIESRPDKGFVYITLADTRLT